MLLLEVLLLSVPPDGPHRRSRGEAVTVQLEHAPYAESPPATLGLVLSWS